MIEVKISRFEFKVNFIRWQLVCKILIYVFRKQNGNGHANGLSPVPPVSAGPANQISDTSLNVSGDSEADADFLDMSWPADDWKKQGIYLFLFGITGPLYILIPDVRRPGKEKWVVITFINSILAIAIYRYSRKTIIFSDWGLVALRAS